MIDRTSIHVCTACGLQARGKFGLHIASDGRGGKWRCTGRVRPLAGWVSIDRIREVERELAA